MLKTDLGSYDADPQPVGRLFWLLYVRDEYCVPSDSGAPRPPEDQAVWQDMAWAIDPSRTFVSLLVGAGKWWDESLSDHCSIKGITVAATHSLMSGEGGDSLFEVPDEI